MSYVLSRKKIMRCPNLRELPQSPNKTGWPWSEESIRLATTMPDGSEWPRISLVTPSYNQRQFIEETIRSILLQGYPNLEYIIIDGGSTDGTLDIIRKYEPWLTYWISERDDGQTFAIQRGMDMTSGEIVNWLNSDDYLLPNAARELAIAYHNAESNECVLSGNAIYVTGNNTLVSETRVAPVLDRIFPDAPPLTGGIQASWFLSKNAWDKVGGVNVNLNYTMDSDLYYRCSSKGIRFVSVNKFIAAYRRHDETKTLKGWRESIAYKRQFYYQRLNVLDKKTSRTCRLKIRRLMFGHYLKSISDRDTFLQRIQKILLALRECPMLVTSPYQLHRFYRILVGRSGDRK